MARSFPEFQNEETPETEDHLVGFRSNLPGGERRFSLQNLLKVFGIVSNWSSGTATDGQVASADGSGGVEFRDNTFNVGSGTESEILDANASGDAKRSGLATLDVETKTGAQAKVDTHTANQTNPHFVTKAQVGLVNVDNTPDSTKPVSVPQQTALDLKANVNGDNLDNDSIGFSKIIQADIEGGAGGSKTKLSSKEYSDLQNQGSVTIHSDVVDAGSGEIITSAERSKLLNIETAATADQSGAEIKSLYEAEINTNAFTDAEKTKLSGLETSKFLGTFINLIALQTAFPSPPEGSYAHVDTGAGNEVQVYIWDASDSSYHAQASASSAETAASIKTKYESNPDTNAFSDAEQTKLTGIELGATADQTDAEIKIAYETNANTNAFTDAEQAKLSGIEAGATADQTGAEIKAAYEGESNTNAFTDSEKTKLAGIESGATADLTGSEIKSLYEAQINTNAYTDAEKNKLNSLDANHYGAPLQTLLQLAALLEINLTDKERRYVEDENVDYFYDQTAISGDVAPNDQTGGNGFWIRLPSGGDTASQIKTKYESNADTNAFTDSEKSDVALIGGLTSDIQNNTNAIENLPPLHVHADTTGFEVSTVPIETTFGAGKRLLQNTNEPDITDFVFMIDFKTAPGAGGRIIGQRLDSATQYWTIDIQNNVQVLSAGSNQIHGGNFRDNEWHTLTVQINTNSVFVDGNFIGVAGPAFIKTLNVPIEIAAFNGSLNFNGQLRRFMIFSGSAVTSTDILNYESGSEVLNNAVLLYKDLGSSGTPYGLGSRTFNPSGSPVSKFSENLKLDVLKDNTIEFSYLTEDAKDKVLAPVVDNITLEEATIIDTSLQSTASTITGVMAETWGVDLNNMGIGSFDGAGKFTNAISSGLTIKVQGTGGAPFNVPAGDYYLVIYGMQPGDGFNSGSPTFAGTKSNILTVGTTQVWKFSVASATTATQLYVFFNNISLTAKHFFITSGDPSKNVAKLKDVITLNAHYSNETIVANAVTMTFDLDSGDTLTAENPISQATTFEVSNVIAGRTFRIEIPIDATGGHTLTLGSSFQNLISGALDNTANAFNLIIGYISNSGNVYYEIKNA